jgi:hypothetical protein
MTKMLPIVEDALQKLKGFESKPSEYENGKGYWDDYCLVKLLEGVLFRYIAYPVCLLHHAVGTRIALILHCTGP